MRLAGRLARIENELEAERMASRGLRMFITTDGGAHYVETTTPKGSAFDFARATWGMGGDWPDGVPLITAAELAEIERGGWQCIVIEYVDMTEEAVR